MREGHRIYLQKISLRGVPEKQLFCLCGPHSPLHCPYIQISSEGQSPLNWHITLIFSNAGQGIVPFSIDNGSTMEWFGMRLSVTDIKGPNVTALGSTPSIMGSNIRSTSLTLTSVVDVGTFMGRIEVRRTSSSVLFSSLYPLVAVLLGAAVVVRLLVESVCKSFIPLFVVLVAWLLAGAFVGGLVDAVLLAHVREVVLVTVEPVVLNGLCVVVDDFVGALGSVNWLLIVTSKNGTSVVTTSGWGLEVWIMYNIYKNC